MEICPKAVPASTAAAVSSRRRGLSERLGLTVRATDMRRSLESKAELEAKLSAEKAELKALQDKIGPAREELRSACGLFRGVFRQVTFWGKVSGEGLAQLARSAATLHGWR